MKIELGVVLQDRWKLVAKLSTGTYSKVYLAYGTDGTPYAVKVDETWWISDEKKIYDILHQNSTSRPPRGIPKVVGHGYEEDAGFLVLPRLGISINQLWFMCQKRFTHATIAKIAIQAIRRLEYVHSRGVFHGDIVAKNFVIGGIGEQSIIYLLDYGNARRFTEEVVKGKFRPNDACVDGSCPRDDLMALARMLVKFHRDGNHTWLKEHEPVITTRGFRKYLSCLKLGEQFITRSSKIAHYWEYLKYVDHLETTQMPDYRFLVGVFRSYLDRIGDLDETRFQWMDAEGYRDMF